MWIQRGNKIYFLSDRGENHKTNIWSYNTTDKSFKQETNFDVYDVKFPSLGPENIVLENGGKLHLFNLASGKTSPIEIQVPSEHIDSRTEWKDLSKSVNSYFISPTGKRGLFEARGEIFTVPAESGITQNLTNTSNAHEQSPNWSPDGKSILYQSNLSDSVSNYYKNGKVFTIAIDGNDVFINQAGEIFVDGVPVDNLLLVEFKDQSILKKEGKTLFLQ